MRKGRHTAIAEITGRSGEFRFFPNPANDQLTCRLSESLDADVVIGVFDVVGKKLAEHVLPAGQSEVQIPVSKMPSGIYLITVRNETGLLLHREKIIKE